MTRDTEEELARIGTALLEYEAEDAAAARKHKPGSSRTAPSAARKQQSLTGLGITCVLLLLAVAAAAVFCFRRFSGR